MTEIRRDTTPMSRADIEAALRADHRDTLPLPDAEDAEPVVCGACAGSGRVEKAKAAR